MNAYARGAAIARRGHPESGYPILPLLLALIALNSEA